MSRVTYTEVFSPDSSLVEGVYYDANTSELTVVLHDELYRYSNVDKRVFNEFKNAHSAGRFYAANVKRTYGPGEYLGTSWDVEYDEVSEGAAPDMTSPLYDAAEAAVSGTKGTPKGLTYAVGAVVTNVGDTGTFSLTPTDAAVQTRKHKVVFETDTGVKTHTLQAGSVDEAAWAVRDIGAMLDVDLTVKEVTVYFE